MCSWSMRPDGHKTSAACVDLRDQMATSGHCVLVISDCVLLATSPLRSGGSSRSSTDLLLAEAVAADLLLAEAVSAWLGRKSSM